MEAQLNSLWKDLVKISITFRPHSSLPKKDASPSERVLRYLVSKTMGRDVVSPFLPE